MHARRVVDWTLAGLCSVVVSCGSGGENPSVQFKSGPQRGSWYDADAAESTPPDGTTGTPPTAMEEPSSSPPPTNTSGSRAGATAAAGRAGGTSASAGRPLAAGSGGQPSGTAGEPGESDSDTLDTSAPNAPVRFEVTTLEQNHQFPKEDKAHYDEHAWGPRNMGAIWVQDGDTFIRTLQVWATTKMYNQYLVDLKAYCKARGGKSCGANGDANYKGVDVTSSATLKTHKKHIASWDLTNTAGQDVRNTSTTKKYTLYIEVSDYDVVLVSGKSNALNTVEFDISAKGTITDWVESDHSYFSDMKLTVK